MAAIIAGANLILCNNSTPLQLAVATNTYAIALLTPQESNMIPPHNENCVGIQSTTAKLADIKPETIIQQLWQG